VKYIDIFYMFHVTATVKKAAAKTINRMGRNDAKRILAAIRALGDNPDMKGAGKIKNTNTLYRYRVGGRRIIFNREGYDIDILDVMARGQSYDIRRLQKLDKD